MAVITPISASVVFATFNKNEEVRYRTDCDPRHWAGIGSLHGKRFVMHNHPPYTDIVELLRLKPDAEKYQCLQLIINSVERCTYCLRAKNCQYDPTTMSEEVINGAVALDQAILTALHPELLALSKLPRADAAS